MLEVENWKVALKLYEGHTISALTLAYQLIAIKQSLQRGQKGIPNAIAGLDLAIESLSTTTLTPHDGPQVVYQLTIEGR
jgi:hypothetical protein